MNNRSKQTMDIIICGIFLMTMLSVVFPASVGGKYGMAGDAGDGNPTTFKFASDNSDKRLTKLDGTPIAPPEVNDIYGTPDGFSIYDRGKDVVSRDYAKRRHWNRPLEPLYYDLSDRIYWHNAQVVPGTVGIDPTVGRFKFAEGDDNPLKSMSSLELPNGRAFDVKVVGDYAYLANDEFYMGLTVIDISSPFDPNITGYTRAGKYPSALDVIYPFAYVMDGYRLYLFDVSDPCNPLQISYSDSLGKGAYGIDVDIIGPKRIAFAGALAPSSKIPLFKEVSTLYIMDVTSPLNIKVLSKLELLVTDSVLDVNVEGSIAFVSVMGKGVILIDVSNVFSPRFITTFKANIQRGSQVVLSGDYLYISDYGGGLQVLDIRDISSPKRIHFDWYQDDLDDISLDNNIKYSGKQSVHFEDCRRFLTSKPIRVNEGQILKLNFMAMGYQTYDWYDPPRNVAGGYQILWDGAYKSPHVAGLVGDTPQFEKFSREFTVPQGVSTIQLRLSSGIWGSTDTRGTVWFDDVEILVDGANLLSNPGFEDGEDKFQLGYVYPRGISKYNDRLLVSDYTEGVRIIDASNAEDLNVIGRYVDRTEEHSTFIRAVYTKNVAYLVEQFWGLKTLSVRHPSLLMMLGDVVTTGFVQDVIVQGDYAYVANSLSGIWVVDIQDPRVPQIIGGYHTGDSITQLALDGSGYLYCANSVLGRIDVLDIIRHPRNPKKVASVTATNVMKMTSKGNLLFVASNKNPDLYIFDISDPTQPTLLAELELVTDGGYRGLAVMGNICSMACHGGGFHLIDVFNPADPTKMGSYDEDGENPWGVALMDDLAYVSYIDGFIRIFDISDPFSPQEVGIVYDDLKQPWNMLISGYYMHVTDYGRGVKTYDIRDPLNPIQIDKLVHAFAVDLDLQGEYLYEGEFGHLNILDPRHSSQAPMSIVTVRYNSLPFRVVDVSMMIANRVKFNRTYNVTRP